MIETNTLNKYHAHSINWPSERLYLHMVYIAQNTFTSFELLSKQRLYVQSLSPRRGRNSKESSKNPIRGITSGQKTHTCTEKHVCKNVKKTGSTILSVDSCETLRHSLLWHL